MGNFEKNNKELPKIRFCGRALKCHSPLKRYQFTRTKHYLLSYVFFFRVRILKRTELLRFNPSKVLRAPSSFFSGVPPSPRGFIVIPKTKSNKILFNEISERYEVLFRRYPLRGGGVLPIMAYTGRLRPKGVPFSRFRHVKG